MNHIPQNWGWYVAAIFLLGPYVLLAVMADDMLARVIGLSFINIWAGLVLLWVVFQNKNILITGDTWLTRRVNQTLLLLLSRLFLMVIIILYFYFSTAYVNDIILIHKQQAPIEFISKVTNIRVGTGALSVTLTLESMVGESTAYYFPRNTFEEGYTYKFWYLPNTREIVKTELISTNYVTE